MGVQDWLGRIFDPPVTQRHFDRAMAEQTEAIREVGVKVEKGNPEVVAAVEAGNVKVLAVVQEVLRVPVQMVDGLRSAEAVVTADDGFRGKVNDCW